MVEGEVVRAVARAPSASAGGCFGGTGVAYTYTQPCAGSRGINGRQSISVSSVCSWGDGVHSIRGSATDTGGGTSLTAAVPVKVDCSAPSTAIDAGPATLTAGLTLEPLVATQDAASGVATTTIDVSTDGGTWSTYDAPLTVAAGRTYRFRARATDVAGNVGPWTYSDVVTGIEPTPQEPVEEPARPDVVPATEHPTTPTPTPTPRASQPRSEPPTLAPLAEPPAIALKVQRLDPQVRILRAKSARRSLTIAGTVANGYADRITVRATTRGRRVTRHTSPRAGRWSLTLRRPARGATRVVVTAAAGERFTSARAVAIVR
ncbi:MAG: hypothetical protein AVDCRST_MAG85-370 [uncultured Solirubrobacteraceae bacterium]|uniref:Bacterial Ig-like domain-containing protein n=1 Tax=uncultured Solirubrobacteraceae bacterium TaxID=1162706 RepID=A0A6J4RMU1_9ACTN|nr:MAG: hypothetical protein AVDCRST_MAG85-370 [uncultured Solirubrobacteraceae bacterium]